MSVTINADTSDGLKFTSDTSGEIKLQSAGTDKITMTSAGNVGIGTSSPSSYANQTTMTINGTNYGRLDVANGGTVRGSVYGGSAGITLSSNGALPIGFETNGTERMRIDSSGNVLVGKTTLNITGNGFTVEPNANGAGVPGSWLTGNSTNDVHGGYHMYSSASSSYKFYATYAGKIYAVTTAVQGISDQRLKENIEDIDVGLQQILALKPRKFDWKEGKGKNIKGDRGWIAQEFEQIFPEMVDTWMDKPPEGEEPYKSVGADLIPVLVKAIQEQQELIKALETRIQALENA